jgi:predicted amino acid-binding ACT domain protein
LLVGKDHPGILVDVVKLISDMDTNIVHIDQKNGDKNFNLRIIVSGLNQLQENTLRGILENDNRFSKNKVV